MKLQNFTLLYVEDDESTRNEIVEILEDFVKEIYIADDGYKGLELYIEKKPDIVLTDINMPNMTGLEMSKEIKGINPNQHIILLTAFNDIQNFKDAIDIKVDKYITKPIIDLSILFDILESVATTLQNESTLAELTKIMHTQHEVLAVGEMLSNISHQWRQPLSAISTQASTILLQLELKTLDTQSLDDKMHKIIEQTKYLSKTIDDFIHFFDDTSLKKEQFNIKDTILKIVNAMDESFQSNNIKIISNLEDIFITHDEIQLEQALSNIFINARESFKQNEFENFFFIDIGADNTITFKDTAGGIDKDIIKKIFQPYTTTKFQDRGTGLGLYMTNKVITHNFGGNIFVENETFKYKDRDYTGAKFTIKIQST